MSAGTVGEAVRRRCAGHGAITVAGMAATPFGACQAGHTYSGCLGDSQGIGQIPRTGIARWLQIGLPVRRIFIFL